jgi:hypothetical protein
MDPTIHQSTEAGQYRHSEMRTSHDSRIGSARVVALTLDAVIAAPLAERSGPPFHCLAYGRYVL